MHPSILWTSIWTGLAVSVAALVLIRLLRRSTKQQGDAVGRAAVLSARSLEEPSTLTKALLAALPECVILPQSSEAFKESTDAYWAKQETEIVPSCVVRPRSTQDVSTALTLIKATFDKTEGLSAKDATSGIFAIRGGGHSLAHGSSSISNGVVIDLSLFKNVTPSEDGSSVVIGAGAKWMDVSKVLDGLGLAVAGGRNSDVGVAGLTLGGGLSYFSPRFGLVCSNIISYTVCLASGEVVEASATNNPDLWRALKGGSNNFGIVTSFTARSFPSTKIWGGFLYLPSFQARKALAAFHEFVDRADPKTPNAFDDYASGPITSFSYIGDIGMQLVAANLVYTRLPEQENKWPACWKSSGFASLWRFWSTCKVRTLTSATDELNDLNPPGRRQEFAATTVKNDFATLTAAHTIYSDAIKIFRRHAAKGLNWTLVLQPMVPEWARKGDPNPLGLDEGADDPLVNVSFTVNWLMAEDDEFIEATTRRAMEQIETYAAANGTAHRYRYLNYCAQWQEPFQGYGEHNLRFLQDVSRTYDPDGLFQKGCVGGFKLGV